MGVFEDDKSVVVDNDPHIAVECILCGDYVPMTETEAESINIVFVCDECKDTIKWLKKLNSWRQS